MKQAAFILVTSSIFALIALLHALRLIYGWNVTIGEWTVPVWVSAVGLLIAGYLAFQGLLLKRYVGVSQRTSFATVAGCLRGLDLHNATQCPKPTGSTFAET